MSRIVDNSALLSETTTTNIQSKDELFIVLKEYLDKIFASVNDDSKLFWATYSQFIIKKDRICFCSRLNTTFPLYDVKVIKSDQTIVLVEPYKIDDYQEYTITDLKSRTYSISKNRQKFKCISPLEVLGWEENFNQCYEGTVTVRTNFTGWNIIKVNTNKNKLF